MTTIRLWLCIKNLLLFFKHKNDCVSGAAQHLLSLQLSAESTTRPAELPGPGGLVPGVVHSFASRQLVLLRLLLRAAHKWNPPWHTHASRIHHHYTLFTTAKRNSLGDKMPGIWDDRKQTKQDDTAVKQGSATKNIPPWQPSNPKYPFDRIGKQFPSTDKTRTEQQPDTEKVHNPATGDIRFRYACPLLSETK